MKNILILVLISLLFSACRVNEIIIPRGISSETMTFLTPSSYPKTYFGASNYELPNIFISRIVPDIMEEKISIRLLEYEYKAEIPLLEKEKNKIFDKEYTNQYPDNWDMSDYFGRRSDYRAVHYYVEYISYAKRYINFVSKLKCKVNVELINLLLNTEEDNSFLSYSIVCPYYDKQEMKKYIHISASSTKLVSEKSDEKDKWLDAQKKFRMDLKEIADSLEVYDVDRERMQKEELLYDKKYDILAESKAKDLSFDCKLVKHDKAIDDYRICVGKEINKICTKKVSEEEWKCKEK